VTTETPAPPPSLETIQESLDRLLSALAVNAIDLPEILRPTIGRSRSEALYQPFDRAPWDGLRWVTNIGPDSAYLQLATNNGFVLCEWRNPIRWWSEAAWRKLSGYG
jgi:hypothetical protein